jgi:hypothetical protein
VQSKKAKIKRMIKSECEATATRAYTTTYKDIKKYFGIINDAVFSNKLSPFNDIIIKDLKRQKVYGQVWIKDNKLKGTRWYLLEMDKKYKNFSEFLNTLGHEMVHLYQLANCGDTGNHNKLFYSYRPKLKQIGLGQI